tara:strand:- start:134 stop:457 length:324 start_codon:yes stop_codon:yes gene_type:complete
MAKNQKQSRAYVCKVTNKKARTSSSKEYFQVFTESGKVMLFTTNDLDKAAKRADKNPEDVVPVEFVEPAPKVVEVEVVKTVIKEVVVEKIVEVPAKGFFAKLFGFGR